MNQATQYTSAVSASHAVLLDSVLAKSKGGATGSALLDSVVSESKVEIPERLQKLMDQFPSGHEGVMLDSIAKGAEIFRQKHGMLPTGDLIEAAVQQGMAAFVGHDMSADGKKALLDSAPMNSATSTRSDPQSLQPNRAVVATLSAIAEAIPFASYLPIDIGSNEGKLAILSHVAGSTFGDYTQGALMDGVNAGGGYTSSSRKVRFTLNAANAVTSKFTTTNLTGANRGFCNPAGTGLPVLRGRTIIYVNGRVVCRDSDQGQSANSPFSGAVNIGGTSYTLTGQVTVADGSITLTPATALPAGTSVYAEAFVNYEVAPQLAPLFAVNVETYKLLANPWRGLVKIGIDSATQIAQELGLDGNAEAIISMRTQFELERHYLALQKVKELGLNNTIDIDFEWDTRNQQMVRAQIFQDVQAQLSVLDQKVAEATMDHGITHYYVGSWLMGIFNSLPSDMFVSSGITNRPGIFRVGRLFNKYEIYYTPMFAEQAADFTEAQMIGVGRASSVARCPIVLGDAVSATFVDMAVLTDFNRNAGTYARNFTEVNPHEPSALGCALVTFKNLAKAP